MDEEENNINNDEEVIASFPGLKPSPKTQLRAQLKEASKALMMEHEYIHRLEEALAAHGVKDFEALRENLGHSTSKSSSFQLHSPHCQLHEHSSGLASRMIPTAPSSPPSPEHLPTLGNNLSY